jgi:hypothetical protein
MIRRLPAARAPRRHPFSASVSIAMLPAASPAEANAKRTSLRVRRRESGLLTRVLCRANCA